MPALVERLKRQLAARGVKNAYGAAVGILKKRGHVSAAGTLTTEGRKRQKLGASGRAKDRAAKTSGRKPSDYKYNPKTNRARLKNGR